MREVAKLPVKDRTELFQATAQGREAFKSHIEALEKFLKSK